MGWGVRLAIDLLVYRSYNLELIFPSHLSPQVPQAHVMPVKPRLNIWHPNKVVINPRNEFAHVVGVCLNKHSLFRRGIPITGYVCEICSTFAAEILESFDCIGTGDFPESFDVGGGVLSVDNDSWLVTLKVEVLQEGCGCDLVDHLFDGSGIFLVHAYHDVEARVRVI